jgi:poly(hydroxyalkanoate) granule-associated protein
MKKKPDNRTTDAGNHGPDSQEGRDIWLAGLGALGKAQQQGGKAFDALVAEGLDLQRKAQAAAQAHMAEATARLSTMAGGLSEQTGQSLDRLGGIFEERVAKALLRLDVASRTELQDLRQQVEALRAQLAQIQVSPAPTESTPPTPAPRRRSRSTG